MSISGLLLYPLPTAAFRNVARTAIRKEFSPPEAKLIWARTVEIHGALVKRRQPTSFGVNFLLRYFEWGGALYQAMREFGTTREHAGALIETINWTIFRPALQVGFYFSRLRSAVLKTRVRWVLDMMFRTIFTRPFQRHVLPSEEGLAFNVTVCPLAQFFQTHNVPELTRYAACSLDWKMAQDWGIEFRRTQTIAEGHQLCDFKFTVPAQATLPLRRK